MIEIERAIATHAKATAMWTRGVVICCYVGSILLVLMALAFAMGVLPPNVGLAIYYFVIATLTLFIAFVLDRFSTRMRLASRSYALPTLVDALGYEGTYWRVSGVLTVLSLTIVIVSTAVPAIRNTVSRVKNRVTARDIEAINTALEKYALANHQYPNATSIDNLAPRLAPRFLEHVPLRDAWGRPFSYTAICENGRCIDYRLSSQGSDGDFTYGNGHVLHLPDGLKP